MSRIREFAVAICASLLIWAAVPTVTHAGTGQNWDCSWGYLQTQNWDNGQTLYKVLIYPGQSAPSSVQPLFLGSTASGVVTEAIITGGGAVSSLVVGVNAPSNGAAIKTALTSFAGKPDCPPPTGDTHATFRGFNVSSEVSHMSH